MDDLCCGHLQIFWPLPIINFQLLVPGSLATFPLLELSSFGGTSAFTGMTCQKLLLSVLWSASYIQWPFLYSVSVFYPHTSPLDLIITLVHSISQIANSGIQSSAVTICPQSLWLQLLTAAPSSSSSTNQFTDPLFSLPGHQISPFSLSSNLAPVISKTLLLL